MLSHWLKASQVSSGPLADDIWGVYLIDSAWLLIGLLLILELCFIRCFLTYMKRHEPLR